MRAILSTPMLLTTGTFKSEIISLTEAIIWTKMYNPTCYTSHETVRLLDIDPTTIERAECHDYYQSLVLKPNKRLAYGKEYTLEEIEEIGVTCMLTTKLDVLELTKHYQEVMRNTKYANEAIRTSVVSSLLEHVPLVKTTHYPILCNMIICSYQNKYDDVQKALKILKNSCIADGTFKVDLEYGTYNVTYSEQSYDPLLGSPTYYYQTDENVPING